MAIYKPNMITTPIDINFLGRMSCSGKQITQTGFEGMLFYYGQCYYLPSLSMISTVVGLGVLVVTPGGVTLGIIPIATVNDSVFSCSLSSMIRMLRDTSLSPAGIVIC